MTPLEQWLSAATDGLSPESAARVRSEIEQHYQAAAETGEDAIAALGDPKAANRGYREVLITQYEAAMAPALTQPKRNLPRLLLSMVLLNAFLWSMAPKDTDPSVWYPTIAILSTTPFAWFYLPNTLQRARIFLYVHLVRNLAVVAIAWWFQSWLSAVIIGTVCFMLDYLVCYQRLSIFRKLAAGQVVNPFPGEPGLTHIEAVWLNTLRKGGTPLEYVAIAVLFAVLISVTVWLPANFLPMTTWIAVGFVARRTLPIYTEQRSRWFRTVKWSTVVVAAAIPFFTGVRRPWAGGLYLALFCLLFDYRSIALRRKLPVDQWPKRLYW